MEDLEKEIMRLTQEIGDVVYKENIHPGIAESALNFAWTCFLHAQGVTLEEFKVRVAVIVEGYDTYKNRIDKK